MAEIVDKQLTDFYTTALDHSGKVRENNFDLKQEAELLKWNMRVINKYISKYSNRSKASDSFYASDWINSSAPKIWESLFLVIQNSPRRNYYNEALTEAIKGIYFLLEYTPIFGSMLGEITEDNTNTIVKIISSRLYLTSQDISYFEENSLEFLKNNDENIQKEVSPFRYYLIKILLKMLEQEKFQTVLFKHCKDYLDTTSIESHRDTNDPFKTEMVYSILEIMSPWFKIPTQNHRLHGLLKCLLVNDTKTCSPAFLKIRLLTLLKNIFFSELQEEATINIFHKAKEYLFAEDKTIRLSSIMLIGMLIETPSIKGLFTTSDAQQLLELTLKTILETENGDLVSTFRSILSELYSLLGMPYLPILIRLVAAFNQFSDHLISLESDETESQEIEEHNNIVIATQNCCALIEELVREKLMTEEIQEAYESVQYLLHRCFIHVQDALLGEGILKVKRVVHFELFLS